MKHVFFPILYLKNIIVLIYTYIIFLIVLNVLIWCNITGQTIASPNETTFTSLHDVFACFAIPSVSWKPMEVDLDAGEKVTDSLKLAFDDSVSTLKF